MRAGRLTLLTLVGLAATSLATAQESSSRTEPAPPMAGPAASLRATPSPAGLPDQIGFTQIFPAPKQQTFSWLTFVARNQLMKSFLLLIDSRTPPPTAA